MANVFTGCLAKPLEVENKIRLRGYVDDEASNITVALITMRAGEATNTVYRHTIDLGQSGDNIIEQGEFFYVENDGMFIVKLIIKEDYLLIYDNTKFITKQALPRQNISEATHIQIVNGQVQSMVVQFGLSKCLKKLENLRRLEELEEIRELNELDDKEN